MFKPLIRRSICRTLRASNASRLVHNAPKVQNGLNGDHAPSETSVSGGDRVIFYRKDPWLLKWGWAFVGLQVFWCASMAEMVWSRWTMADPDATKVILPLEKKSNGSELFNSDGTLDSPAPEWVLRPAWQRGGLATASLAVGAGVAGMFYFARRRVIRQLSLRKDGRSILAVFESAGNHVHVHRKSACNLLKGRAGTELSISVEGMRGFYTLSLTGAEVPPFTSAPAIPPPKDLNEEAKTIWRARRNFAQHWDGKVIPN